MGLGNKAVSISMGLGNKAVSISMGLGNKIVSISMDLGNKSCQHLHGSGEQKLSASLWD